MSPVCKITRYEMAILSSALLFLGINVLMIFEFGTYLAIQFLSTVFFLFVLLPVLIIPGSQLIYFIFYFFKDKDRVQLVITENRIDIPLIGLFFRKMSLNRSEIKFISFSAPSLVLHLQSDQDIVLNLQYLFPFKGNRNKYLKALRKQFEFELIE